MGKSINELLKEFDPDGEHVFTKEEFLKEEAELNSLFLEHFNLKPEEIKQAVREHLIPHEELDLLDRWIKNEAFRPFVMQE